MPIISTHTLTWSVTYGKELDNGRSNDFNSHAHVERDLALAENNPNENDFNSHAHVERDIATKTIICTINYFNSHAHVERDRRVS